MVVFSRDGGRAGTSHGLSRFFHGIGHKPDLSWLLNRFKASELDEITEQLIESNYVDNYLYLTLQARN